MLMEIAIEFSDLVEALVWDIFLVEQIANVRASMENLNTLDVENDSVIPTSSRGCQYWSVPYERFPRRI